PELARRWSAGRRFFNAYGPTETTVCATGGRYLGGPRLPIGVPIANTRVYLLDRRRRLVATGTVGELCVAGAGLARGYLERPALSAERFIPDPYCADPAAGGERLYRTGDLARYLGDGTIEFLGRIDNQVKVRGFRLELGEIETVLAAGDAVRECAVLVRGQDRGDRVLVAYVVPGALTQVGELRELLRRSLPEYMVPSTFVLLEALPLLPNGKVDRAALPAPETRRPEDGPFEAPRDPIEELLAEIWTAVLEIEQVGAKDNFFERGGHSLLATQVISRIREAFEVELPVQALFEAPTVAELAVVVRTRREEEEGVKAPPMVRLPRDHRGLPRDPVLLSFAQQRLWFLDQFEPGSPVYNIPQVVRLSGAISPSVLERVFNEVVRRHEVLRTTFEAVGGRPRQVIAEKLHLPLPVVDLELLPAAVRGSEVRRLAAADELRPFDLTAGPLVRFTLVRLAAEDQVLVLNMHHIASDGWSMGVLIREVTVLYQAFSRDRSFSRDGSAPGRPSPIPELPIQYADYAHWQRQWLAGEVLEAELGYWRKQLAGVPRLELPTDRPRPTLQSFRGRYLPVAFSEELGGALAALARRPGATLFMILLAAFKTLLSRWTRQQDVVVGSPIAGRTRREIEDLIGFFVNNLVLRSDLSGRPTFDELVTRVRRVTLDAYLHQTLPFERLVEELAPERNLGFNPLFQVMLALQNAPVGGAEQPGLSLEPLPLQGGTAKFELSLLLSGTGRAGLLTYNTDLFDQTTARRFVAHFERVLEGIAVDPERRIGEVALLSAAERHQLLRAWNDVLRPDPRDVVFPELFEAQVEASPEAVAVACPPQQAVSYRELNRRANRLGARLRELGVGGPASRPDEVVGICLERSAELIVGLLAIFKAGGAYLPLEPEDPPDRLAYLLEDSGVSVVLAEERTLATMPAATLAGIEVLSEWDFAAPGEAANPVSGVTASHRAYVIYTSGSTGRPKGVMVEHGSLVDYLRWVDRELFGERVCTVPLVTPVTFDASLKQLFAPLLRGAPVQVLDKQTVTQPAALLAALAASGDEALNCVPSLWEALLAAMESGEAVVPRRLRCLWVGGEPLREELVRRSLAVLPALEIRNLYGPTEATANASAASVSGADRPTIGRPLVNRWLYVLDPGLRPVPIGVAGELAIAGPGVARGYLGRPGLTAERFVPDPLGGAAGRRLYRTGDRVRFLSAGPLEFLGRVDHQVKLRGFRIELGEIESVLRAHASVRECVVVARGGRRTGPARLVAYVAAAGDSAPEGRELRAFLLRTLPEYMVPAAFVVLEALPLLPSGKVDRGALPEPETSAPAEAFVAPRDPSEELIAEIWAEVLDLGRVGAEDNFFDLGGHSLVATQVVSRVRETFAVEVALPRLFEAPTVAGLATVVRALREEQQGIVAPPMMRISRDREPPLSFAQQRIWFLDQFEPESAAYNVPLTYRLSGAVSPAVLERVFNEVVRRHEVLRTTFAAVGGRPRQVIATELELPLPVVDLGKLPQPEREAETRRLARAEARRPFDLARGPLVRVTLLRLAAEDQAVLMTMHHIVSDAWSFRVLLNEVVVLHEAFSRGEASPLPELPLQYADFAQWQRQWLVGEVLEKELAYWRVELAGVPRL
ncbi:MAG: amino acid adenylation domain-containing protein, partial [bacterium]|nr:amino acid adenylation domain-containing protein [bacterium]